MLYRLLADATAADATAAVHFAFVAYVVIGGFLAWRWPRGIWTHLLAFGWGFATVLFGFECPLTHLENWARHRAGEAGLAPSGFIDHYLTGVIYPDSALGAVRVLVAVCVVLSWVGYAVLRRRAAGPTTHLPAAR